MRPAGEDDIVMKFLHTADWHLGRRFKSFGESEELKLTRARLEVVDRLLLVAERNTVDAVLCAGDLFDEPSPDPQWWEGLSALFAKRRWSSRPVFLLPGNHDPFTPDSIWAKDHKFRKGLPDWVHVIDRPDFEFALSSDVVLYGVPCTSRSGAKDPTESIPMRAEGDDRVRIGIVHGSTFDVPNCQTHFPINKDAAIARGLDYLAIGDTHGYRLVPPDREIPPTIYPGAPEATAFDEREPGHVAVVYMSRSRRASVRRERVAHWTWEEARITTMAGLRDLTRRSDLGARVLRLQIAMRVSAPEYDEAEKLLEDLSGSAAKHGRVGVLALDRQGLELDTATVASHCTDLPDVLRSTVDRLTTLASDPSFKHTAERALYHLYRSAKQPRVP